jgi:acetoin:2,6-dichlorophenolindophenol oxidoreductase subunit beta
MGSVTFLEAIRDAMSEEMRRDPRVFLMGEDVVHNVYGSSGGLAAEFGGERVMDTPLSEAGFVGTAAGAAMVGMRPIVDITIAPFLYPAMDQIVSIIAKARYLYGGQTKVPVVLRVCMLYNINNAAQHSDRPYPAFMGIPGIKIIAPSNPYDMKGLMKAAIRDDDPVLSFEDGNLWMTRGDVPDHEFVVPIGKADVKRQGSDVTVFAVAGSVAHALEAAQQVARDGVSVEVIDPRTIKPLDTAAVLESVRKTGRFISVDPAHKSCSVASEIAATVAEEGFWDLKAPVRRITTPDIHIPFASSMERGLYPTAQRIVEAILQTMKA